jgi:hypothetical protein
MKLELLLTAAWLAATTSAIGPATPEQPPRLKGKAERMTNWAWPNPFASPEHKKFTAACDTLRSFQAREFMLDDLAVKAPTGLLEYRDALKEVFATREYPGSWEGIDPHGYDRDLLSMDYDDMPLKVREWIEEQERTDGPGKGLFAVYMRPMPGTRVLHTVKVPEAPVTPEWRARDEVRVAIFAPGALYEVAPLWVAEGSKCEGKSSFFPLNCVDDCWVGANIGHLQARFSTSPSTAPSLSTVAWWPTPSTTACPSALRASVILSSRSRPRCCS